MYLQYKEEIAYFTNLHTKAGSGTDLNQFGQELDRSN